MIAGAGDPAGDPEEVVGPPSVGCRVCGGLRSALRVRLSGYTVLRCSDCGFVFSDLPASEVPKLYDEHYFQQEFGPYFSESFGQNDSKLLVEKFNEYADVLEEFQPSGEVVDVGCAGGMFLDILRRRGWNAQGVELSPYAADVARRRLGLTVHVGDLSSADIPPASLDAISLLDVLEHLAEPGQTLRRIRQLLRPKGVLILVLPNDRNLTTMLAMAACRATLGVLRYGASRVHQIYHVSYFTPATIRGLLEREGFELVAIRPDETVHELLNESAPVRLGVKLVFGLARALRLQNKMIVVARAAEEN